MATLGTPSRRPAVTGAGALEAVIWDFNGTLIDDVDHIVRSVNVLLARRRLPQLTVESFRHVFGFPVAGYYRKIGFDLEAESMADLSAEFFGLYAPGLAECPLHAGVLDALTRFRESGMRQFVLSAMEEQLLLRTVEHLGIAKFLEAIYGLAHLEGDSKLSRGKDLLHDFSLCPEATLLIGDTDHDFEVANELGLSAVLVANGHQSAPRLDATGRPVFSSLHELRESIAKSFT